MTTLKNLMIVGALLVGAPFYAAANELPDASAVDRQVAATPGPASIPAQAARHHGTRHIYMMTVNRTHKGSKLTPTSNAKPQVKQ
jgi:hypothetical protein